MLDNLFSTRYLIWSPSSSPEGRRISGIVIIPILQKKQLRLGRLSCWPVTQLGGVEREWEIGSAWCWCSALATLLLLFWENTHPPVAHWKQVTFAQDWLRPRAQSRMTFDPYPLTQCLVCLGLRQQLSAPWLLRPYVPILWGALEKGTDLRISNRGYCPAQERPLTTEALLCKP